MATPFIKANRRNAQRSTGPRAQEGKARSPLNVFWQQLIDGFQPQTPVEQQLASLIAEDFWRLQRIRALETNRKQIEELQAKRAQARGSARSGVPSPPDRRRAAGTL